MAKGLPIVWWMDASELGDYTAEDSNKLNQIAKAIEEFEKGDQTLNELKEIIRLIIEK